MNVFNAMAVFFVGALSPEGVWGLRGSLPFPSIPFPSGGVNWGNSGEIGGAGYFEEQACGGDARPGRDAEAEDVA